MKAMIYMPLQGESLEEIEKRREKAKRRLERQGYEVVGLWDEFVKWKLEEKDWRKEEKMLEECQKVWMGTGWQNESRGRKIRKKAEELEIEVEDE